MNTVLETEIERLVVLALNQRISELTSELATAPPDQVPELADRLAVVAAMLDSRMAVRLPRPNQRRLRDMAMVGKFFYESNGDWYRRGQIVDETCG